MLFRSGQQGSIFCVQGNHPLSVSVLQAGNCACEGRHVTDNHLPMFKAQSMRSRCTVAACERACMYVCVVYACECACVYVCVCGVCV